MASRGKLQVNQLPARTSTSNIMSIFAFQNSKNRIKFHKPLINFFTRGLGLLPNYCSLTIKMARKSFSGRINQLPVRAQFDKNLSNDDNQLPWHDKTFSKL